MKVEATELPDVLIIRSTPATDDRGTFLRTFDLDAFAAAGLPTVFAQHSLSLNHAAGTVRGLHLQRPPHAEAKVVRCVRGAVFDVAVDVRPASPTYGRWVGLTLRAGDGVALLVPSGCAHGFQTLQDNSDVLYLIDTPHEPAAAAGYRWDDPGIGVHWPLPVSRISDRDRQLPLLPSL